MRPFVPLGDPNVNQFQIVAHTRHKSKARVRMTLSTPMLFTKQIALLESLMSIETISIRNARCDLKETTIYLHLSQRHLHATASPLDSLKLKDEQQDE